MCEEAKLKNKNNLVTITTHTTGDEDYKRGKTKVVHCLEASAVHSQFK